jgi:hypothetical protein
LCAFSLKKRLSGKSKVRRDFPVFGSEKYQPPPLRQIKVLCTVAVCFSKSISDHFKAKYSSGRDSGYFTFFNTKKPVTRTEFYFYRTRF